MEIPILSVETEISTYLSLKGKKFVPQMHPPNLRIWRYRLVWYSRTLWRPKLRRGLISVTQETTKQIAFVKIRREFSPDFTNAICFVVSCVTEIKPRRSLGLHKVLECRLYPWLLQERLQGRVWEPKFLDFLPELSSLGDRSSGSTVILINYYRHFNPDANSIFFAVSLKTQIWLPIHLNNNVWWWGENRWWCCQ